MPELNPYESPQVFEPSNRVKDNLYKLVFLFVAEFCCLLLGIKWLKPAYQSAMKPGLDVIPNWDHFQFSLIVFLTMTLTFGGFVFCCGCVIYVARRADSVKLFAAQMIYVFFLLALLMIY